MEPKVLIGCPTHKSKDYALKQYAEGIKKLDYKNFDVLIVDNSEDDDYSEKIRKHGFVVLKGPSTGSTRERIVESRNIIRRRFLEGKYDYFLSLEQDVVPPPDIIKKLIERNVQIISALYMNVFRNNFGRLERRPLAYVVPSEEEFEVLKTDKVYEGTEIRKKIESGAVKSRTDLRAQLSEREVQKPRMMNVYYTGLGCMLIKKEVLEKIEFRATEKSFDDFAFCTDAKKNNYNVWLDTSVKCDHLVQPDAMNKRD